MLKQHAPEINVILNHAQGFVLVPFGQNRLRISSPTSRVLRSSFFKVLSFHLWVHSVWETPSSFNFRMNSTFFAWYSLGAYALPPEDSSFDGGVFSGSLALAHLLFFTGGSTEEGSSCSPLPWVASTMLALYCLLIAKGSGVGGHAKVFSTSSRITLRVVWWNEGDIWMHTAQIRYIYIYIPTWFSTNGLYQPGIPILWAASVEMRT